MTDYVVLRDSSQAEQDRSDKPNRQGFHPQTVKSFATRLFISPDLRIVCRLWGQGTGIDRRAAAQGTEEGKAEWLRPGLWAK
jgi:hypothetical protein